MIKKLQLACIAMMLLVSMGTNADTIKNSNLNLNNPDVRKCLLEASNDTGWKLASVYLNSENKLVMIFDKGKDTKIYTGKDVFPQ